MITDEILNKYQMTIGIECHVQLATQTKLFSGADNDSRVSEPNSNVSPIDYGLPGMLPVLNWHAVELAVKAGKALNSDIALVSRFDRKHYFYPDLPKGYQTTQMYQPIIGEGLVKAPLEDGSEVAVRIHHAHMEEDAGKLTHYSDYSLVDLNRAGTPLIEVVSEPDIHSPEEAKAFATELYRLMTYAGVTHGDLYHGNMRFDVNISIAPVGSTTLGKRAEIKNLNSFRSVEKAAEFEFKRQVELLEKGEKVVQETRGWDDAKQKTFSQRSKEDAQDYRYMPDADIPPIVFTQDEIDAVQSSMPKLPHEYRASWQRMEIDYSIVNKLLDNQFVAETVDAILDRYDAETTKRVVNWFTSVQLDNDNLAAVESGLVGPQRLVELSQMVGENKLSSTGAKEVFVALFAEDSKGKSPEQIAEEKNLLQVSDESAIGLIVDAILAEPASAKAIEDIKSGNDKAIGYLVGQVMKQSKGKANPSMAQKLIRERL